MPWPRNETTYNSRGRDGHSLSNPRIVQIVANAYVPSKSRTQASGKGASAHDVLSLLTLMQTRVSQERGIHLQPEVKRVGVFAP